MSEQMPPELIEVLEELRDKSLWQRVAGLNGARMEVRFCCNSEKVRRVQVRQLGGIVRMKAMEQVEHGVPRELQEIRDKCEGDRELWCRVLAFTRGKFDIVFLCGGFGLEDVLIGDVS